MIQSLYWQHNEPIKCPKRHAMLWLGSVYWICEKCHTLYVQVKGENERAGEE